MRQRDDRKAWTQFVTGAAEKNSPKFGNKKTNGYDSKKEYLRAMDLQLLQKIGAIKDLREQVPIEIIPKQDGEKAAHWVADFIYVDTETGEEIWEDCKGMRTREYILKRKLVLLRYGKKILET